MGSSLRKKARVAKPIYQAVLHDDEFNTIADRVFDSMTESITTFTTTQEALKKTVKAQLTQLKSLVSQASHVAIPTPVQSTVLDLKGHRHRFSVITLINIC